SQELIEGDLLDMISLQVEVDQAGRIFVGTDLGLMYTDYQTGEWIYSDHISGTNITSMVMSEDSTYLIIAAEGDGIFHQYLTNDLKEPVRFVLPNEDFSSQVINHMNFDALGNIWLSTNSNGLIKLNKTLKGFQIAQIASENLAGANSISSTFLDRESNFWVATKGEGLLYLNDQFFSFFNLSTEKGDLKVNQVYSNESGLWLGTNQGLVQTKHNPNEVIEMFDESKGLVCNEILCIERDAQGTIWVGTKDHGLYYKAVSENTFKAFSLAEDYLNRKVNDLMIDGPFLYIATDFGVYQVKDKKVVSHLTIQSGLPHNVINSLFKDSKNRIWIGSAREDLTFIENGLIKHSPPPGTEAVIDGVCFTEDKMGNIWIGTEGSGLLKLNASDSIVLKKVDGLVSDYCYSIVADGNDHIWVGHRGGLSKVNIRTNDIEVFQEGQWEDLNFINNAAIRDIHQISWLANNKELLSYNPERDVVNQTAPKTTILSVQIGDSIYDAQNLIELPSGNYKVVFEYIGLSLKASNKVTYESILEGHDMDWSDFGTDRITKYPRIGTGTYTFKVRSYNADGIGGDQIQEVTIIVKSPFWQQWWFIVTVVLMGFLLIRFIVFKREQIMRANQVKLEHALEVATKEVRAQKELVDVKNKDITDSIVYAKSIQKAMLPHPKELSKYFDDAFVFYKPRDIVSGDFYWVEQFENKIIVACADCTGHGVPGAFMSLISSVLLKGVSRLSKVSSPNEFLKELDAELVSLLQSKDKAFSVEDGMDVSVIEIDLDTNLVRVCSAKRPVLFVKDGVMNEIKGDRFSIGGHHSGTKNFKMHEIQLSKGDTIYQFSDGLPDQFGGEKGKKLKKKKIVELIESIHDESMTDQQIAIRDMYLTWKG
ncbi:MAG: ligand-binding sensor domain-containing protein, partial [Flavobacteriales bacterium]